LSKTLTPVGDYSKTEVRKIAAEIGLGVAAKKDSQEICFVPDNNYGKFISSRKDFPEENFLGNFIDGDGNILGRHEGIYNYTVGQRKGLKLALGKPTYVKKINPETKDVILSSDADLFSTKIVVTKINYMALSNLEERIPAFGKIRYNHKPAPCEIYFDGGELICEFEEPQRAPAPGQSAVFYDEDGEILLGGEII
jgi:tRNA-specific 2-thiouridylase